MTFRQGDDHDVARAAAQLTGAVLVQVRSDFDKHATVDQATLRKEGDRRAQAALADYLAKARPDDLIFSEEAPDDERRLAADRVWIVDPLDGTREFSEPGRSDWAVHVALWERGDLVAGAVALPAVGLVLTADQPPPLAVAAQPPRILVSRTRPPAEAVRLAEAVGGELVPLGSAGAKVAAVVRGDAEVYVHAGGQYQWDSAAPVAVARSAGLHTSRLDGSPMVYNTAERSLPDLVVCRQEIAAEVLDAVGTQ